MLKIHMRQRENFMNKTKGVGLKELKNSKVFIKYSNDTKKMYGNIRKHNANKEHKILLVFDDVNADIPNKKKLNPIVTGLFIRDLEN